MTFSTDIFHPLVVPLTTYTFSASPIDASSTVGASGEGRLPPGAFSLRYGFPDWFASTAAEGISDDSQAQILRKEPSTPDVDIPIPNVRVPTAEIDRNNLLLELVHHIQDAFEKDALLDNMPVEVAGDPSAWHAWRAHRGLARDMTPKSPTLKYKDGAPSSPKNPGEWKWDGVWESRVSNGIASSINDATLFGSAGGGRAARGSMDFATTDPRQRMAAVADRQIRFAKLDDQRSEELKAQILAYGSSTPP
jgi:hypothetical protein